MIYLDHNATTALAPAVLEAMMLCLREDYGNPSSLHPLGERARYEVEKARVKLAANLGVQESNLIFTSGGTESNNLIIHSIARQYQRTGCHVVASAIEHPAVLEPLRFYSDIGWITYTLVPPNQNGVTETSTILQAIGPKTRLVCLMLANNETGVIQPVKEVVQLLHEKGVMIHTDAVQGWGKIPLDLSGLGVDYAALSAHKIHGPKGTGLVYARDPESLHPIMYGGGQESMIRPGTENVPGIVGMAAAAEWMQTLQPESMSSIHLLRTQLETGISHHIPEAKIVAQESDRLPNTSCIIFPGWNGVRLVSELGDGGVACSSGSACSTRKVQPSHVLTAMKFSSEEAISAIRFSLGFENTTEEIEQAVRIITKCYRNPH